MVSIMKKLLARSPYKIPFVKNCGCFDPQTMAAVEGAEALAEQALQHLVELRVFQGEEADAALAAYTTLINDTAAKEKLSKYSRDTRLDKFLLGLAQDRSAPSSLLKFIRIVLCLTHGQAAVERGFSINKQLLVPNLAEKSLIAQRIIRDHLNCRCDNNPINCLIDSPLLASVRNSHGRYKLALQEEQDKREQNSSDSQDRKRKLLIMEEKEQERKRLKLHLDILDRDIDKLQKS